MASSPSTPPRGCFRFNALILISLCSLMSLRAEAFDPKAFLTVIPGELPLLLSAPHGGTAVVPGASVRTDTKASHFVVVTDVRTDQLALAIAADVRRKLGRSPYVVIAKFSRKYADPNRAPAEAAESERGRALYAAYQDALGAALADIRKRWGVGLLIDVHGQGREKDTIFRGTAGGRTVRHLVAAYGQGALSGPDSVFGRMAALGYAVSPSGPSEPESDHFDGGYITQTYGSADGGTVDSIQMEFGFHLRTVAALPKTAEDTATALAGFLKAYLLRPGAK